MIFKVKSKNQSENLTNKQVFMVESQTIQPKLNTSSANDAIKVDEKEEEKFIEPIIYQDLIDIK